MAPDGIRFSKRKAGMDVTPIMEMKRKRTKKVAEVMEKAAATEVVQTDHHVSDGGDNEEYGETSQHIDHNQHVDVGDDSHDAPPEEETMPPSNERVSLSAEDVQTQQSETTKRKTRGPTKMRKVAKHHDDKVEVEFASVGEHVGTGSVTLSSFLGPLVREHVPVLLDDWRHLDEELRDTLWEEVQGRFNLTEEWQKESVFRQMGCLWRSSKSRLTRKVMSTKCKVQLQKLKPDNIQSITAWNNWVRRRTSSEFKSKSDNFRQLRRSQIPHTTSRKGMARLSHDMKKKSSDPKTVTRSKVWVAGHTHADGTPVREEFAETIDKVKSIDSEMESTGNYNVREDAVSQVLGKDKPGRLRGMGRGFTFTKLVFLQARDSHVQKLEATQAELLSQIEDLRTEFHNLAGRKRESDDASMSELSNISKGGVRCQLLDWCSSDDIVVGEGELCSSEQTYKIGRIPLGPNAAAIMVKSVTKPEAYVWRPTSTIMKLGDSLEQKVAWPFDKVILDNVSDSPKKNTEGSSAANASAGRVYIYDWNLDDEIIGEGVLCSTDPKDLVSNIPLGPNAAILMVDLVIKDKAFLWRPSAEMSVLGDALNENIAWPMDKIQIMSPLTPREETAKKSPVSASNSTSSSKGVKQRCILLDCNGSGERVAQGRIYSTDPADKVHFVPLGPNASKVWVEVSKSDGARVWRPNQEVEFIRDAVGTTVAWPNDKVILL